jgi:cell division protein FtsB
MAASEPRRRRLVRRLTAGNRPFGLALAGLLALLIAMGLGPLQRYVAMADRVDALTVTRDTLTAEVERLEDRRAQLEDPDTVELLARQELGLVKEGEIPFVVVTPEPDIDQLGPETDEGDPDNAWYRRLGRALSDLFG